MKKTVVELFAGVGGFRVGLNRINQFDSNGKAIENNDYDFVWANQWEPSTKTQPAFECYSQRFGESDKHVNKDISQVDTKDIPSHNLLVGGFPCQDYSVARTKSGEKGIQGKKGVLWWEIVRILEDKKPSFILLENVDRLLKSPAKQRGRDFGVMLKTLDNLGYGVEWRVINAAEYGHPQKRRRVFIFGFRNNTNYYTNLDEVNHEHILLNNGFFSNIFPIDKLTKIKKQNLFIKYKDIVDISNKFNFNFENSGVFINGNLTTAKYTPVLKDVLPLKNILLKHIEDSKFYLNDKQKKKFEYLKGSKRIPRTKPDGTEYFYSEGKMSYPENLKAPGRTMLTSEGSINRSTHVVKDLTTKKIRKLHPIECERLNQFPDNWTNTGMTTSQRYFMMGNALVCGIVNKLSYRLDEIFDNE